MKKKNIASIILIVTDIILLALSVTILPFIFLDIFGFDFIEYENWFGEMENPIRYRFGAGSVEIAFSLIKFIGFSAAHFIIHKGQSKIKAVIFMFIHIIIAVLGLIYCFKFADGSNIIYYIRLLTE